MQNALRAGVKSIEHGQLIDDATAKMIQQSDAWVCMQPFLNDEDAIPFPPGSFSAIKYQRLVSGTDNAYGLVKKYNLNMGFDTDTQNDPALADRQGAQLAKLARWFEPWQVLRIGTSTNYKLFKLSGPRDPYPGNNNFVLIMKDGSIYKNTMQ